MVRVFRVSHGLLLSASSSGELFVWANPKKDYFNPSGWARVHGVCSKHSIINLSVKSLPDGSFIVAALSIKAVVSLYHLTKDSFKFVESLCFGTNITQRSEIFTIPNTDHTYIAIAPTDTKVYLYEILLGSIEKAKESPEDREELLVFQYRGCIAGHEDRIMEIATIALADGSLYLATGSRDCSIRIFAIRKTETAHLANKHKTNAFGLECAASEKGLSSR